MGLFIVFKKGVYRHESGGVFSSLVLATEAAIKLRDGESDDYHSYEVVEFELDEITAQASIIERTRPDGCNSKYYTGGELSESPIVFDSGTKKA